MIRPMSKKLQLLVGKKSIKGVSTDDQVLESLSSAYEFLIDYPDLAELWGKISDERVRENFADKIENFNNMMLDAQEISYRLYHDLMKKLGA